MHIHIQNIYDVGAFNYIYVPTYLDQVLVPPASCTVAGRTRQPPHPLCTGLSQQVWSRAGQDRVCGVCDGWCEACVCVCPAPPRRRPPACAQCAVHGQTILKSSSSDSDGNVSDCCFRIALVVIIFTNYNDMRGLFILVSVYIYMYIFHNLLTVREERLPPMQQCPCSVLPPYVLVPLAPRVVQPVLCVGRPSLLPHAATAPPHQGALPPR